MGGADRANGERSDLPLVTVGVPVYNGALTLRRSLESIVHQTYGNLEIIISDNCSCDETQSICQEFRDSDHRIRYIRQLENIGGMENFKYVLYAAHGKYFMWSAADDYRSPDFIERSVAFLEINTAYVASTSPNCMEGDEDDPSKIATFSMDGSVFKRFISFLDHAWQSHGIFYSLCRTQALKGSPCFDGNFFAADWAHDLYLASQGGVNRVADGLMISGRGGISNSSKAWSYARARYIGWLAPFAVFSGYALALSRDFTFLQKSVLLSRLIQLNAVSAIMQFKSAIYPHLKGVFH